MADRMPIEERYWMKVDRSAGPEGCWPWTASRDHNDYGQFWDGTYLASGGPRTVSAHRWAYQHFVHSLGPDEIVCHTCDYPRCQNPRHMFAGTHRDNAIDRERKGRGSRNLQVKRGEENGSSRLTWEQVRAMRGAYRAGGRSQAQVAQQFSVSPALVSMIVRHELWKEAADG